MRRTSPFLHAPAKVCRRQKSVDGEEEEQEEVADVTKPSLMHHRQSAVISKGNILIYKVGLIQGDTATP